MWVAKFILRNYKDPFQNAAFKHNINALGYISNSFKIKNSIHLQGFGIISGNGKDKKQFIKELKKNKLISKIEIKKDFISILIKRPYLKESDVMFNPAISFVKPIIINKDGNEIWEVASWDRKKLTKLIKIAEKKYDAKLLKLKQEKLSQICLLNFIPKLTFKQKKSLDLAIKNGYYNHPRKITLKKLAEMMGISFTTYQFHLRRAENKLIPGFIAYS